MKLAVSKRGVLWTVALLATLWLAVQTSEQEEAMPQIVEAASQSMRHETPGAMSARPDEGSDAMLAWGYLAGRSVERGKESDLFRPHSWYVPPPPVPAQTIPPPKPMAPPAPFTYMGKLEDTPTGTLFFLAANNRVHAVAAGETIDRTWRVDSEDAISLHLTYIPLGLPQALSKSAKPVAIKPNENQGAPG
jgi:hypothetical protein